jgi:pimeloyl-ACP methyl ester carboxylesterase
MPRIYDRPEVCRTYFFPQPGGPLPELDGAGPVALELPDGTAITGYWSRPLGGEPAQRSQGGVVSGGAPTMLYLHGNGETISDQLPVWPDWAREAGANIFFVDYPGYARSGGVPTFTGCCQAAQAAFSFLSDRGCEIIVAGRSVGSIFALDVAAQNHARVKALMLESGVAELVQRLSIRWEAIRAGSGADIDRAELEAQLALDFDHRAKLDRLDRACPVLVLHTRMDSLIPSWHAERLAAWAGDRLLRLELFEVGDHNTIQWLNADLYRERLGELVSAARARGG